MNYQKLINRQEVLMAELEAIDAQLRHDAREPFGVVVEADNYGVSFHEKSLPWSEVSALIEWLQSLVGEQEPKAVWASATVGAGGVLTAVESQEKPWPVWYTDEKGTVQRVTGIIKTSGLVFAAPNLVCARDFWIYSHLADYADFVARWRKRGEVVE